MALEEVTDMAWTRLPDRASCNGRLRKANMDLVSLNLSLDLR
jgi:hypothetical protein